MFGRVFKIILNAAFKPSLQAKAFLCFYCNVQTWRGKLAKLALNLMYILVFIYDVLKQIPILLVLELYMVDNY